MKSFPLVVPIAALALALSACGGSSADEEFVVGYLGPTSGAVAFTTTGDVAGMRTALDEINRDGGVHDKELALDVVDDQMQPDLAIAGYRNLAREGAVVVTGVPITTVTEALVREAESTEVPMLGYGVGTDAVIDAKSPYVLSTAMLPRQWAGLISEFIAADPELSVRSDVRVAFVGSETVAAEAAKADLETEAERDGSWDVVGSAFVPSTATDATQLLRPLSAEDPDLIAIWLAPNELFSDGLQATGLGSVPVLGPGYTDEDTTRQASIPSFFYPQMYGQVQPGDTSDEMADVLRAAKEAGTVDESERFGFINGYLMGQAVGQVLEQCGADCDAKSFAEVAVDVDFAFPDGVVGPDVGWDEGQPQLFSHARWAELGADGEPTSAHSDWMPFR